MQDSETKNTTKRFANAFKTNKRLSGTERKVLAVWTERFGTGTERFENGNEPTSLA